MSGYYFVATKHRMGRTCWDDGKPLALYRCDSPGPGRRAVMLSAEREGQDEAGRYLIQVAGNATDNLKGLQAKYPTLPVIGSARELFDLAKTMD